MSREPRDNQHLPPWLRGVPLPPRPSSMDVPAAGGFPPNQGAASTDAPAASTDMPDWLRDLNAAPPAPAAPAADFPAWLRDEAAADQTASAEQPIDWLRETPNIIPQSSGTEALPDWLSGAAQPPAAQPADAGLLPDWLREESQAPSPPERRAAQEQGWGEPQPPPAPAADTGAVPSWLRDEPQAPPPQADQSTLPDWLRGDAGLDAGTAGPGASAQSEAEALPTWLGGMEQPEATPGKGAEPPDWLGDLRAASSTAEQPPIPDWLRDEVATPAPEAPAPEPQPPAYSDPGFSGGSRSYDAGAAAEASAPAHTPQEDVSGIPDWLRDIPSDEIQKVMSEDDEADITIEPFTFEGLGTTQAEPAPGAPAWLSGISGEPSAGPDDISSWFQEPASKPVEPANLTPGAADMPLWLQDLEKTSPSESAPARPGASAPPDTPARPAPPAESRPEAPEQEEQIPAWLQDTQPSVRLPAVDMPAWLQEADTQEPPPAGDVPTWLQDIEQTPVLPTSDVPAWHAEPPAAAMPPSNLAEPTEDLPSWLRPESPQRTPAPGPTASEDLPEWLRTPEPAGPAVPPTAGPPAAPSWLPTSEPVRPAEPAGSADLPPWLRDESGQPLPSAGMPGETNLPEWLRGAPIEPTSAPAEARRAPPAGERTRAPAPTTSPTRLDWFEEAAPARPQEPAATGEGGFFGGADLPAWLRPPEPEPSAEISPSDARSLDWLTKLKTLEEEGEVAVATQAPLLPLPTTPIRTQAQLSALALLERLAAEPFPEAAPVPQPAAKSALQRIGVERLLYVALLITLLIALAVPAFSAGLQVPPEAPGAQVLKERIGTLTEDDVVLIGYEWDARRIGELQPLEQAVIGQLIEQKVKLVLVSTDPQGTLLLFDLYDDLIAAKYEAGGVGYVLLGYKPGGELALRSIAQDLQAVLRTDFTNADATQAAVIRDIQTGETRVATVNDFSMIVVLADDAGDVQGWMEQIHRSAPQVPLAFLLPQETAPVVQPYLQQEGIYHLAGKQGALAYTALGDAAPEQNLREAGQQRLGTLVFVGLLATGAIGVVVSNAMKRRRKPL